MKVNNDSGSFLTCLIFELVRESMFRNDHCSVSCLFKAQLVDSYISISISWGVLQREACSHHCMGLFIMLKTVATLFNRRLALKNAGLIRLTH